MKKFWTAAAVMMTIVIAYVAGAGGRSVSALPSGTASAATAAPDYHRTPVAAATADRGAMLAWYDANEACQGGPVGPDAPICMKRDRLETRLGRSGWCWHYNDRPDAEDDWHRCSDNGELAEGAPIDDGWARERDRPKPSALAAYETAAEPIDVKVALVNIVGGCGLRPGGWDVEMGRALEDYRNSAAFVPIWNAMTDDEREQARRFDRTTVDAEMRFNGFGAGLDSAKACAALAKLPFVYSDANFVP